MRCCARGLRSGVLPKAPGQKPPRLAAGSGRSFAASPLRGPGSVEGGGEVMRKENIYAAMRRGLGGAIFWGWVGDAGAMGSVVKVHNVRGGGNGIAGQLGEWDEGVGGGLAEK